MLASDWSIMPILTSDWLIATEATEAMAVMKVMENTASMDTAEATDMAGEIIVINILIMRSNLKKSNLMNLKPDKKIS